MASNRMADAYAEVLFDPNMTKEMIRIGEETLKAVKNPKTTSTILNRLSADAELLWNTIVQNESIAAAHAAGGHLDKED